VEAHELGVLLRDLAQANPARRKALWRLAQAATSAPWFDAAWQTRLATVAATYGLPFNPIPTAVLSVGEAWLLLYDTDRNSGLTGRIRFAADETPDQHCDRSSLDAVQDALLALNGLVGSKLRRLPTHLKPERFGFVLPAASGIVEGSSLGLASAIALLSAALDRPMRSDVAATATLRSDGTLVPVHHLEEKLHDLAQRRPEVRRVLVARGQSRGTNTTPGIEVRECSTLEEAVKEMELDLADLEPADLEYFEHRLHTLVDTESVKSHTADGWMKLVHEVCAIGHALQIDSPDKAATAFGHATLFALHAGRENVAKECRKHCASTEARRSPVVTAWLAIVDATDMIDRATTTASQAQFEEAIRLAEKALALTERLAGSDRERLLGQALGTLGRAYLHAGQASCAIAHLEKGAEHHQCFDAKEAPRSLTSLATALRHAGRIQEATTIVHDALARIERAPPRALYKTTRLYAQLELGRCLLQAGDAWGALHTFQSVIAGQQADEQHPRIAALRGAAAAYRQLGDTSNTMLFRARCQRIAVEAADKIIRLLGAMAIGDSLIAGETCSAALQQLWVELTGSQGDVETKSFVERWVY